MSSSNLFRSQNGNGFGASANRASTPTNFTGLLARSEALGVNDIGQDGGDSSELPRIHYGIGEIERQSEAVAGKGKRKALRGEGQALLSNFGVNTSQLVHDIGKLPSSEPPKTRRRRHVAQASRVAPVEGGGAYGTNDGDVKAWGRNWHETVILSGIEMQRQRTVKAFNEQFQQRMLANWELEKSRILQDELGVTEEEVAKLAASASKAGLGSSSLRQSSLGQSTRRFPMSASVYGAKSTSTDREGGLAMHTKMLRYSRIVSELNSKRLRKETFGLCRALEETVKDDTYTSLPIAFRILAFLVGELQHGENSQSQPPPPPQERQYARAYREGNVELRQKLVVAAKSFLEQDFEEVMQEVIDKNPKEAAPGGNPEIDARVKGYVAVVLRSQDKVDAYKAQTLNGQYLYAQMYYLLRAGYTDAVEKVAQANETHLSRDDPSLLGSIREYRASPNRRISRNIREGLQNDFNAHIRNNPNADQFRYALYKIIGRLDVSRKNIKVAATTEDWLWTQLCLTREQKEQDTPQDRYDLQELSNVLNKYGNERYDQKGTRPFAWFNLLLLTSQFEQAIGYLYSKPQLRTEAVHFALALHYYGLLNLPRTNDVDLLSYEDTMDRSIYYLDFARLIRQYIAPFHTEDPETALKYAYAIALGGDSPAPIGDKQKQIALEVVRDIALASKDNRRKLLGSIARDGSLRAGVIQGDLPLLRLSGDQDYLRQVVLSAADQSILDDTSEDSIKDSIRLYLLAGSYEQAVETVNRAMGQSLVQSAPQSSQNTANLGFDDVFEGCQDIFDIASRLKWLYDKDYTKRSKVENRSWDTMSTLVTLKRALRAFDANDPAEALKVIRSTNLLPLDNDASAIPARAENFKSLLDQPTIQNLDVVILTTMRSLHMLSQQLKSSIYEDANRTEALREYKVQAQALIRFAGLLRLRLGADVYRQLSSLNLINRCFLLIKLASKDYKVQAQALARFAGSLRSRLGADVYRQLSSLSAFI